MRCWNDRRGAACAAPPAASTPVIHPSIVSRRVIEIVVGIREVQAHPELAQLVERDATARHHAGLSCRCVPLPPKDVARVAPVVHILPCTVGNDVGGGVARSDSCVSPAPATSSSGRNWYRKFDCVSPATSSTVSK